MSIDDVESTFLDESARAGWLYYVGGKTQEEIAKTLGVSRQRAQRLVSRAVCDGLVHVRLVHPIAELLELEASLLETYGLEHCRVAPSIGVDGNLSSVASFAARMLERFLLTKEPLTIGFGIGRSLRATIESLAPMNCEQHRLVSIIGNIAPDGSASSYGIIMRVADIVRAPHYPLPTPVVAKDEKERALYTSLKSIRQVINLAQQADLTFVGIGQLDKTAPLFVDGFINQSEWQELRALGGIGELAGSIFDDSGNYIDSHFSTRLTNVRVQPEKGRSVIAIASGSRKVIAIKAALQGKLINGLVTDEETARALV